MYLKKKSCTGNNNVRGDTLFLWHDFELKVSFEKGITRIVLDTKGTEEKDR